MMRYHLHSHMLELVVLQGGPDGTIRTWGSLIGLIIVLILAVWTYGDAKKYSSHPAILWALAVFLAPLFGILFYFILGRNLK